MSFNRSCQAISSKCAVLPLINNFIKDRINSNGLNLSYLGPAIFKTVDEFLEISLSINPKYVQQTPISIKDGQVVLGIGDIHADLLSLLGCLYLLGVIDLYYDKETDKWNGGNWIGGNTIVVQCGDLLDRGGRSSSVETKNIREEVDIIQYIYYLNISAQKKGGGIYWILGNHDISRVLYKQDDEDDETNTRIVNLNYRKYTGNQYLGWGGRKKMESLFKPGGKMALYMSLNTFFILQVGYYVFVHGGITLDIIKNVKKDLKITVYDDFFRSLNNHAKNVLVKNLPMNLHVKSILWDRTWSKEKLNMSKGIGLEKSEEYCTYNMKEIFKELNMNWKNGAFVVGHSIQKDGIPLYCKGRVWRIDLGMSEAFSSGKIHKLIGGIKIFMHPRTDKPVEVLVVMNYMNEATKKYADNFVLYVSKKYKKVLLSDNDNTKIEAYLARNIIKKEISLQKKRRRII